LARQAAGNPLFTTPRLPRVRTAPVDTVPLVSADRRAPRGEEGEMLRNVNYNLLEEITQLSKALYRFDKFIEDARTEEGSQCTDCVELWKNIKRRNEADLEDLMLHFKSHIDRGLVQFKRPTRPRRPRPRQAPTPAVDGVRRG
jgi:hypothetical protein